MAHGESAPRLIRAAALALLALGLAVLVGWSFGIDALKTVLPGANSMKVNTALGFMLLGVGLWFTASERTDIVAALARLWAPRLAALLGLFALFEYATGLNLGLNEILFRDDAQYGARGRMSVVTAIAFILFAVALLVPTTRTQRNNVIFLTLTTLGFAGSILATIGYLYGLPLLYQPIPASSIAVHTAIGLVIAFVGVFATRADIGWLRLFRSSGVTGLFGRLLLPLVIIVPLALGWAALSIESAGWLDGRTALALLALLTIAILAVVVGRAGHALGDLEKSVRRREDIYQSITNNALDAFMLADADGCILDWNPQAERMFGWTRDEVMGRVVREVIMPPETRAGHAAGLDRFKAGGEYEFFGRRVEVTSVRRDGTRLPVELIAIPIQLESELFFGLFARDLTGLKAAEDQLRQAQKMEAVGRLTGGIAHDFNNTLTAIIATLDSVLPRMPEALRPRIETALNAADRAAAMIKQLLAFSRKQILKPQRLAVNDVVEHTARILRPTLGERVQISLQLGEGVPDAMADGAQVESALLNLSINARDAMPEGGALTIETKAEVLDADYAAQNLDVTPGQYVMIAVSDTGVGMDTATRERAFEPFFTTKDMDRGTGLGLSMVHGFAKQSGGHVKIYSETGHGTTVRLYLPLADVQQTPDAIAPTLSAVDHGGNETILLVEDNELVRTSAATNLRDLGYTVLIAEGGREALAELERGARPDLLFTDIIMPDMTGIALAKIVERDYPGLRVLYTSGYTHNAIAQHDRLPTGAHFLSKPYRVHELAAHIRAALNQTPTNVARAG